MEKIIKKIIDIEYQAQSVIDNAQKEREERKKVQKEALKDREGKLSQDASRKIQQIRDREMKEADEILAQEFKKFEFSLSHMEKIGLENKDLWTKELVNLVLKR